MEIAPGRVLVGLAGHEADVPLIRYAAMLTRLNPVRDDGARSPQLAMESVAALCRPGRVTVVDEAFCVGLRVDDTDY